MVELAWILAVSFVGSVLGGVLGRVLWGMWNMPVEVASPSHVRWLEEENRRLGREINRLCVALEKRGVDEEIESGISGLDGASGRGRGA